jgi:choice-of-anchor C domain-containing protein
MKALRFGLVVIAALLASLPASAPGQAVCPETNLVVNGDFETPDTPCEYPYFTTYYCPQAFNGWTVSCHSVDLVDACYFQPASGQQSVDLSGDDAGGIYQDLPTDPTNTYLLRFALAGNVVCSPTVKTMRVWWGRPADVDAGSPAAIVTTLSFNITGKTTTNMGWLYFQFKVVAPAPVTRLKFQSLTAGFYGPVVDNVSVTELPDLAVTSITDPPPTAAAGQSFTVTDTTANVGDCTAPASTTRYHLSLDQDCLGGDPLLTGSRSVGQLLSGQSNSGTASVTIPTTISSPGCYFLCACADDPQQKSENIESNNCRVSNGRLDVKKPDLVVSSVNSPPARVVRGTGFSARAETRNIGPVASAPSQTGFRLSKDQDCTLSDLPLTGAISVPGLMPSTNYALTITTSVPATTPPGFYVFCACADNARQVSEMAENNNCTPAPTLIEVVTP